MADIGAADRAGQHWVFRFHTGDTSVRGVGSFEFRRASGRVARALCALLRMPRTGTGVPVRVAIRRRPDREIWIRVIGGRTFVSRQLRRPGLARERIGPLELYFVVATDEDGVRYEQKNAALRLGPLRQPIPHWAAPSVRAAAKAHGKRSFFVRVDVHGPGALPLLCYCGVIEEEA